MKKIVSSSEILIPYLTSSSSVNFQKGDIPECPIPNPSSAIRANSYFFGNPQWAKNYFETCHRDDKFKELWQAAGGSWDDKIVVDLGCGPGNLYATLGGSPRVLIGVDISRGALEMAQQIGYTPLLADAHCLPLTSGFADLVALNATLHHCDDMVKVLAEASRLVRPGGMLIVDHDPQLTAWNYKGLVKLMYQIRLPIYKLILRNLYIPDDERFSLLASETHHRPGDGVTETFFRQTLEPLGFTVKLYPHNHTAGAETLQGNRGRFPHWRYPLGQCLSGIDPNSPEAALSLMCIATLNGELQS